MNQIYEVPRRTVTEMEYQNPSTLILKYVKQLTKVDKSHQMSILKMKPYIGDTVLHTAGAHYL